METHARISRIEEKIDRLYDVMVKIASIDEQLMTGKESMERLGRRIESCEALNKNVLERMHEAEIREADRKHAVGWMERVIWIQLSGLVGMVFWYLERSP